MKSTVIRRFLTVGLPSQMPGFTVILSNMMKILSHFKYVIFIIMLIEIPEGKLSEFCRKNSIKKLAFFGSVLRDDFRPESDIDILVEFKPDHVPGFFRLAAIERELSHLLGDKKVDLRTPEDLSKYFRDEVVSSALVQYEES